MGYETMWHGVGCCQQTQEAPIARIRGNLERCLSEFVNLQGKNEGFSLLEKF